jgi:predicted nucleotidyltransferase
MDIEKKIDNIVTQIIKIASPEKIILFGSVARGEFNRESDLDFLIVVPDGVNRRKTAQLIYNRVDSAGVPFDVLVTTESKLEEHKDNIGLIYKTILAEGKTVYAA